MIMNNDLVTDAVVHKEKLCYYLLTIIDIVVIKEISNNHWYLQKITSCFTLPERIGKNNVVTVVIYFEM